MKKVLKLSWLVVVALTTLLQAAESQSELTIDELVRKASRENPELNFYRAEIAVAKGGLKTAGTRRNPELSLQAGYKNTRDKSGSTLGNGATWALSVNQSFEYPGRIALRKAVAEGDVRLAELHLEQFRVALAARVRALASTITVAREKSAAAREVADRFRSLSEILSQRQPAGVTPLLEMRIIDANTVTLGRQEREAELAERTAIAELNQLRGQPASAPLQVASAAFAFSQVSLPALFDAARRNGFDIRIRETELMQQGFRVSLSKNERYPTLAVGPYYSQENAADKEQQVGIGISVPLPFWDRGNIQTSKAREQQAQASLLNTQREVERRVAQSAAIFQAKREEIDKWQADTVTKFRETAELADRNYRLGAVPLSVYVETQKQYLEVLSAAADLKKEALQAAQELEILTGLKLYRSE